MDISDDSRGNISTPVQTSSAPSSPSSSSTALNEHESTQGAEGGYSSSQGAEGVDQSMLDAWMPSEDSYAITVEEKSGTKMKIFRNALHNARVRKDQEPLTEKLELAPSEGRGSRSIYSNLSKSDADSMEAVINNRFKGPPKKFKTKPYEQKVLEGYKELQVQIKDTTARTYECDKESLMSLIEEYLLPIFDDPSLLTERSKVYYDDEETEKGSRTVTVDLTEQECKRINDFIRRPSHQDPEFFDVDAKNLEVKVVLYKPSQLAQAKENGSSSSSSSLSSSESEGEGSAGQTNQTPNGMGIQGGSLSWSQPGTSSTASHGDSEEQLSGHTLAVDKLIDSAAKELQELTEKINEAIKLRSKTPSRIWFEEPPDMVNDVISQDPLQMAHIELLHPHTSHYVIPHNQKHLKMFAAVIYSTENREGALEEAEEICTALKEAGFTVVKREWQCDMSLRLLVHKILSDCSTYSSIFVLCVMSHGRAGVLLGPEGEVCRLNDLLKMFKEQLHPNVPLVVIIQSCRDLESQPPVMHSVADSETNLSDASRGPAPSKVNDTLLTRANTVILFATMFEGKAERGVLLNAVAGALKSADGKTDICSLFVRASFSMSRLEDHAIEQVPEMRSTLRRLLILPKPKKLMQEGPEANSSLKEEVHPKSNLQEEPSPIEPIEKTIGQEVRKTKIKDTKSREEKECVII